MTDLRPSSASQGFFQSLPHVPPQYTSNSNNVTSSTSASDDVVLSRILSLYLPHPLPVQIDQHLHELAKEVISSEVMRLGVDAELNVPTLHPLNTFGELNNVNALRTGEGWRGLKEFGISKGTVALGYNSIDGQPTSWNRRVHQMAMNHIWAGSSALVTCPAAMSDGAAILLGRHLDDGDGDQPGRAAVFAEARKRLISFDPAYAWTSGQWMTERSGGSDVSQTETSASKLTTAELAKDARQFGNTQDSIQLPLGLWKIDGFKWFSSATDADMVVMLAQTNKGLSAFYAPMRRMKGSLSVMNGVRITRLKSKLGTKALPTSELEIKGMRAWLIGEEGKGVREIASILNTTRIWTACGALGGLARGLAIARAYSRVRKVQNKLLQDNTQHIAWMARETVRYRASLHLAFFCAALLGIVEQGDTAVKGTRSVGFLPPNKPEAESLLRFLVPVAKAQCSLAAVRGLRECMESLGGVGYCENNEDGGLMNIARIFRDTNVNPIWEGTTSVMVEDVVRVITGKGGHQALASFENLVRRMVKMCCSTFEKECSAILAAWVNLKQVMEGSHAQKLHYAGRSLLCGLEHIICSLLLMVDATSDNDPVSMAVVSRWLQLKSHGQNWGPGWNWQSEAAMDQRIFSGHFASTSDWKANL